MLNKLLKERKLSHIWDDSTGKTWTERRKEIINLLCNEVYGILPPKPDSLEWEIEQEDQNFCAGKVTYRKIILKATLNNLTYSFPIYASIPKSKEKLPFFVHINFRDCVPDKYMPVEEICDHGFAILSFCYKDVTSDNGDFTNGLAGIVYNGRERENNEGGKIALWAWTAMRVMDYAQTLSELDLNRAALVGHSRLGKTALLAGSIDERFSCVISNDSGCSGAAITRGKQGETVEVITKNFPFWFCENYKKYIRNEFNMPFDQHFLAAAIAPRKVYIASSEQDLWADPVSEFLTCVAADEVYKKLGLKGFVHNNQLPKAGETFHQGDIGYHMRKGLHYLGREDWLNFIKFLSK